MHNNLRKLPSATAVLLVPELLEWSRAIGKATCCGKTRPFSFESLHLQLMPGKALAVLQIGGGYLC